MRKMKKLAALLLVSLFFLPACAPAETADLSETDKLLLSTYWVDIRTCKLQSATFMPGKSQLFYSLYVYHTDPKGNFRQQHHQGPYSFDGNQLILLTSGGEDDLIPCLTATLTEKEGCPVLISNAEDNMTGRDIVLCRAIDYPKLKNLFERDSFEAWGYNMFAGIPYNIEMKDAIELLSEDAGLNFLRVDRWEYVLQSGEYDIYGWPLERNRGIVIPNGEIYKGLEINFLDYPIVENKDGSCTVTELETIRNCYSSFLEKFGTPDYAILYKRDDHHLKIPEEELPYIIEDTVTYLSTTGQQNAMICLLFNNVRMVISINMPTWSEEGSIGCDLAYQSVKYKKIFFEKDGDPIAAEMVENADEFPIRHTENTNHSIAP